MASRRVSTGNSRGARTVVWQVSWKEFLAGRLSKAQKKQARRVDYTNTTAGFDSFAVGHTIVSRTVPFQAFKRVFSCCAGAGDTLAAEHRHRTSATAKSSQLPATRPAGVLQAPQSAVSTRPDRAVSAAPTFAATGDIQNASNFLRYVFYEARNLGRRRPVRCVYPTSALRLICETWTPDARTWRGRSARPTWLPSSVRKTSHVCSWLMIVPESPPLADVGVLSPSLGRPPAARRPVARSSQPRLQAEAQAGQARPPFQKC